MRPLNYFLISITIHLVFFSLIFLRFHVFEMPERVGRKIEPVLSSYIYTETSPVFEKKKVVKKEKMVKPMQEKTVSFPRRRESIRMDLAHQGKDRKFLSSSQQTLSGMHQGETETLVALLHDAIQKKQQYPENALAMEREGRVKVSFILYNDGSIGDLRLLSSSGTTSLDNAALNAVQEASPFRNVVKYIKAVQTYQIDIVFELT